MHIERGLYEKETRSVRDRVGTDGYHYGVQQGPSRLDRGKHSLVCPRRSFSEIATEIV